MGKRRRRRERRKVEKRGREKRSLAGEIREEKVSRNMMGWETRCDQTIFKVEEIVTGIEDSTKSVFAWF